MRCSFHRLCPQKPSDSIQRVLNHHYVVMCGVTNSNTGHTDLYCTVLVQSNRIASGLDSLLILYSLKHQNCPHPDNTWATVFWWRSAICWSCCSSSTYHGAHGRREFIWRKKWPTSRVRGSIEVCFWIFFKVIVCIVNVMIWSYIPNTEALGASEENRPPEGCAEIIFHKT